MRYSFAGDVRSEYAGLSYEEAATEAHALISKSRGLFASFTELCELYAVMQQAHKAEDDDARWQEAFEFGPVIAERNARPMEDMRKLYPTASDETA
jgi:hypothetical protein